jgi:hypothetical protein
MDTKIFPSETAGISIAAKTCVGAYHYVHSEDVMNEEIQKARDSQIPCTKPVEYKLIEQEFWEEFYCCSEHLQYYLDFDEKRGYLPFVITKL